MYKVVFLLHLFLFFLCTSVFAQNHETDSLIRLLSKSAEDTNKVHLYWKIGASIIYQDSPAALPFFKKGATLAAKLGFVSGMERCYNATSLAFSLNAKYDSALVYINYAIPNAIKAGNTKRLSLAYLNRADVHKNLQNFSDALNDCNTAITHAEKINNKDGLGRIYSIMSDIHAALKQYPQAIANLDKSDRFFERANNKRMIAMNYTGRAELFIYLNEPVKAIPYYKKAIHIADSLQDIENLSSYNCGLAEAYAKAQNYSAAEATAKLALRYAKQTGNRKQEATCYSNLGGQEMLQNNFTKAIEYELKAYNIIKVEKDLLREQGIASVLADAFYRSGNTSEAYKYLKISSELSDSLVKQQFSDETAKLQTTFEVKQKDKEILLLGKDQELKTLALSKQKVLITSIAIALISVMIIGFLLVNRYRVMNRTKRFLEIEKVRNNIARDLHDDIGSTLSSINILSQVALTEKNGDTQNYLERIGNQSARMMEDMGDMVWSINPRNDSMKQVVTHMREFTTEILELKNMEYHFVEDIKEGVTLTAEQRKNLFLIFKETLNNAAKYSGAKKIDIRLQLHDNRLVLGIKDNGQGFDEQTIKTGNGLRNMRERAKEINGTISLKSGVGEGTEVELRLPIA
ncbi:MAG: ATP-binding protein [Cyclobacteriaceae bacterium]